MSDATTCYVANLQYIIFNYTIKQKNGFTMTYWL